jgi:hypothetical protein
MKRMFIALATLFVVAACNTTTQTVRVPKIGVVARDLEREEYIVLGNAEGNACVEQVCWFGIFCTVKDEGGSAIAGAGLGTENVSEAAEDQAMLKALKAQPEADAVLTPRKSMSIESGSMVINTKIKSCVRVFGKSIRIKTDQEIKGVAAAPAPSPSPPPPPPAPTPETPPAPPTGG